jgi:aspartate kinase
MKVFKFGGASVKDAENIKNVGNIIRNSDPENLLIVVSAIGKTTNALETVVNHFYENRKKEAIALFDQIKKQHLTIAKYLLVTEAVQTELRLTDFFTEAEWLLHDKPVRSYDYYYDQVVCIGELLSTCLVSAYLNETGIRNTWLDIRDYFITDNNYRNANIDLVQTGEKLFTIQKNYKEQHKIIVTQGFIGCTTENESTTLGREGSDYSAALIANLCDAESVTIWKDVEGVFSADPKEFEEHILLSHLNYKEVIEMAYYGAQVIHPKTIKPLQNKNIPLYVKCFSDVKIPGTLINNQPVKDLPPIIVRKKNQALLQFLTKDFSFVGEQPTALLYEILSQLKIKPNLTQIGAISIEICLDHEPGKIEQLALAAAARFDVQVQKDLQILTIRHYNKNILEKLTEGKTFLLQQKTKETYQAILA